MEGDKKKSRVVIVIVNWNRYENTKICLKSLKRLDYPNYEVIVVDNHSSDNSAAKLREHFPQHQIRQTDENLGFAGGANIGIRSAFALNADFVLLLNNDTEAEKDMLTELVKLSESDGRIGIASGMIYYMNPRSKVWSYGGSFNVNTGEARHFSNERQVHQDFKEPLYLYVPGCLMLVRRKCLEQIGLLSEKFFHLVEDTEFCLRAQRNGWKLAFTPSARVYHHGSASMKMLSPIYNYYEQRNRLYAIQEYRIPRESFLLQLGDFLALLKRVALSVILLPERKNFLKNLKFVAMGILDFFRGRTGKRF